MWNNAGSFLAPSIPAPAEALAPADVGSQIQSSESCGGESDFELPEEFVVRVPQQTHVVRVPQQTHVVRVPQQTPCVLKITRRDAHHGVATEHSSDDATDDSCLAARTAQAPRTIHKVLFYAYVLLYVCCIINNIYYVRGRCSSFGGRMCNRLYKVRT